MNEDEGRLEEIDAFGRELDSGTTELSRIISVEAIRVSRDRIQEAMIDAMVKNGAAVRIGKSAVPRS